LHARDLLHLSFKARSLRLSPLPLHLSPLKSTQQCPNQRMAKPMRPQGWTTLPRPQLQREQTQATSPTSGRCRPGSTKDDVQRAALQAASLFATACIPRLCRAECFVVCDSLQSNNVHVAQAASFFQQSAATRRLCRGRRRPRVDNREKASSGSHTSCLCARGRTGVPQQRYPLRGGRQEVNQESNRRLHGSSSSSRKRIGKAGDLSVASLWQQSRVNQQSSRRLRRGIRQNQPSRRHPRRAHRKKRISKAADLSAVPVASVPAKHIPM